MFIGRHLERVGDHATKSRRTRFTPAAAETSPSTIRCSRVKRRSSARVEPAIAKADAEEPVCISSRMSLSLRLFPRRKFHHRELSWLESSARPGRSAGPDPAVDRARKISDHLHLNLDEFFEIRVAGIKQQIESETSDVARWLESDRDFPQHPRIVRNWSRRSSTLE